MGFPSGSDGKESPCKAKDLGSIPGSGRSPGEGMATHSSIRAWRVPWTEESGGLLSMGVTKSWTQLRDYTFTFTLQGWAFKESLMSDLVFYNLFSLL